MNLKKALTESKLCDFIKEREPMEVDGSALNRYIDASATPLDSRTKGRSKSSQGHSGDCK